MQQPTQPRIVGTEEMELGIEEQVELRHAYLEQLGEGEVPQFMEQYEYAECQHQL